MTATPILTSVERYLHTSYEYDHELVDGELIERPMPTEQHGRLQIAIGAFLFQRRKEWGIDAIADVRLQVADRSFRVPDICVVRTGESISGPDRATPLFVIEILSPDDGLQELRAKAHQYLAMGIAHVWTVDPLSGECHEHSEQGMRFIQDRVLRVSGTPIEIPINDILASFQN